MNYKPQTLMNKLEKMDGRLFEKLAQNELASMFNIVGGTKTATTYRSTTGASGVDCKDDSTQNVTTTQGAKYDLTKDETCSPQQVVDHANSIGVVGADFSLTADSVAPWDDFDYNTPMTRYYDYE